MYEWVKLHNFQVDVLKGESNATYSSASIIRVIHTMIPWLITSWSKTHCYFRTRLVGWMLLLLIDGMHWRKDGPFGAKLKSSSSQYSMSRTCGPRDIISLVIPRIGDNIYLRRSCLEGLRLQIWSVERLHDQQYPLHRWKTHSPPHMVTGLQMESTTPVGFKKSVGLAPWGTSQYFGENDFNI